MPAAVTTVSAAKSRRRNGRSRSAARTTSNAKSARKNANRSYWRAMNEVESIGGLTSQTRTTSAASSAILEQPARQKEEHDSRRQGGEDVDRDAVLQVHAHDRDPDVQDPEVERRMGVGVGEARADGAEVPEAARLHELLPVGGRHPATGESTVGRFYTDTSRRPQVLVLVARGGDVADHLVVAELALDRQFPGPQSRAGQQGGSEYEESDEPERGRALHGVVFYSASRTWSNRSGGAGRVLPRAAAPR